MQLLSKILPCLPSSSTSNEALFTICYLPYGHVNILWNTPTNTLLRGFLQEFLQENFLQCSDFYR